MATIGLNVQNHGVFSAKSLEAHRSLFFSNSHDSEDESKHNESTAAKLYISNASQDGYSEWIAAHHSADRPQIKLTGDVTFGAGSSLALSDGVTTTGDNISTNLVAAGGYVQVRDTDKDGAVVAELKQNGDIESKGDLLLSRTSGQAQITTSSTGGLGIVSNAAGQDITISSGGKVFCENIGFSDSEVVVDNIRRIAFMTSGATNFYSGNTYVLNLATGGAYFNRPLYMQSPNMLKMTGGQFLKTDASHGKLVEFTNTLATFNLPISAPSQTLSCGAVTASGAVTAGRVTTDGTLNATAACLLGSADTAPGEDDGFDVTVRRNMIVNGNLQVGGSTTTVTSTDLRITDQNIDVGYGEGDADGNTTTAAHRTACAGGVSLRFGGYQEAGVAKRLGELTFEPSAVSALEDKFSTTHMLESPEVRVQSGGSLRINSGTVGTYCAITFDGDKLVFTRHTAAGGSTPVTISF